jgi:hypothetical protein
MKQSGQSNEGNNTTHYNPGPTSDPKWIGKYIAAILGGSVILVGLLGICGCTKKSEQQTAYLSPTAPAAATAPVLPGATPLTSRPAAPGRIVQRKSPRSTYTNDAYGITFRYPLNYKLKTWEDLTGDAKPAAMDESMSGDPAEIPLATVQMPQRLDPKTDFDDGYFSVSANRTLTEETCEKSAIVNEDSKLLTETINGVQFRWTENSATEGDSYSEWHRYAGFANGVCYQVQLGLATSAAPEPADRSSVKGVNSARVFGRLNAILSSLKIRPVAALVVAPAATGEIPSMPVVDHTDNATIGQSAVPVPVPSKP